MVKLTEAEKKSKKEELDRLTKQMYYEFGRVPEIIVHFRDEEKPRPELRTGPDGEIVDPNLESLISRKLIGMPGFFINSKGIIKGYNVDAARTYGRHYYNEHFSKVVNFDYLTEFNGILKNDKREVTSIAVLKPYEKEEFEFVRIHLFPAYVNGQSGLLAVLDAAWRNLCKP